VEEEPEGPVEDMIDVLADAEAIVGAAVPGVVAEIDRERDSVVATVPPPTRRWRRR
jgi:hypothetical protein